MNNSNSHSFNNSRFAASNAAARANSKKNDSSGFSSLFGGSVPDSSSTAVGAGRFINMNRVEQ